MPTFLRRLRDAWVHSASAYEPPTQSDADLRATLTALVDRWAIQLNDHNEQAAAIGTGQGRRDARLRGTRLLHCISDLNIVLDSGRLPHDLTEEEPTS